MKRGLLQRNGAQNYFCIVGLQSLGMLIFIHLANDLQRRITVALGRLQTLEVSPSELAAHSAGLLRFIRWQLIASLAWDPLTLVPLKSAS